MPMKHLRKYLTAVLAAVFALCLALTACDSPVYYSVMAEFDPEGGSVTLSAPENEAGYAEGETVSVAVTANEGYTVSAVTVNGAVAPNLSAFTFKVTGNAVVKAAFEKTEQKDDPVGETRYTVTLRLQDEDMGSAKLSAPADGNADGTYTAGESVTLTVTPGTGYKLVAVVINRKQVQMNGLSVTFEIEGDTLITVTFGTDDSGLPELAAEFSAAWQGTWKSADGTHELFISTNRMRLDGEAVTAASVSASTAGEGFDITVLGEGYIVEWAEDLYTANYVIALFEQSNGKRTYFVRAEDLGTPPTIEEKYRGDWYLGEEKVLEIGEHTLSYRGTQADVVTDGGYYEVANDGYQSPLDAHVYFFIADGEYYRLSWYPAGEQPVIGDDSFTPEPSVDVVRPSPETVGEWTGVGDEKRTLTITATQVLIDGTAAQLVRGEGAVGVRIGGVDYSIILFNEFALSFRTYTYDEYGRFSGYEDVSYFAKKRSEPLTPDFPDYMIGAWTAAGYPTLNIAAGSFSWGDLEGVLLGIFERGGDGGDVAGASVSATPSASDAAGEAGEKAVSYTVAFGNIVYNLSYEAEAEMIVLSGNQGEISFLGGKIPTAYRGNWQSDGETGSVISVGETQISYGGGQYRPTFGQGGLSFTAEDGVHTLSLAEDLEVPVLTDTFDGCSYLNADFAYPSVSVDGGLLGAWEGTGVKLNIGLADLTYNGKTGKVLVYDEASLYYLFFADGKLYVLQPADDTLLLRPNGGDIQENITLQRAAAPKPVSLPAAYLNTAWTTETGETLTVDGSGALYLGGTAYSVYETDGAYTFTLGGEEMTLTLSAEQITVTAKEGTKTVYFPKTTLGTEWQGTYESADKAHMITVGESKITVGESGSLRDIYVFTLAGEVLSFGGSTLERSFGGVLLTYTEGDDTLLLLKEGYEALSVKVPAAVRGEYEAEGTDHLFLNEDGIVWGERKIVCFGITEQELVYTLGLVMDGEIVFMTAGADGVKVQNYTFTLYHETEKDTVTVTVVHDSARGSVLINGTPYTAPLTLEDGTQITVLIQPAAGEKIFSATLTMGGDTHDLSQGSYTGLLNGDADVNVVYTVILGAEFEGKWIASGGTGTVSGGEITVEDSAFSDGGIACPVAKTADGYTYTLEETEYTFSMAEGTENTVLHITWTQVGESFAGYSLKEGTAGMKIDDQKLLGTNWHSVGEDIVPMPLSVSSEGSISYNLDAAVILAKNGDGYVLLLGGGLYRLTYVLTDAEQSLTLTAVYGEESIAFAYEEPQKPVKLPKEFVGEWTGGGHTLSVSEDGTMKLDGTAYDVFGSDGIYFFTAPYNGEDRQWQLSLTSEITLALQIGYDANWRLVKDVPLKDWNWGSAAALEAIKAYSGVYTASGVPDLTIYQSGKVTWGSEVFLVKYDGEVFTFVGNTGYCFQFAPDSLTEKGFTVMPDGNDKKYGTNEIKFTRQGDAPADYSGS